MAKRQRLAPVVPSFPVKMCAPAEPPTAASAQVVTVSWRHRKQRTLCSSLSAVRSGTDAIDPERLVGLEVVA
jgi:hypothetical protein